MLLQIQVPPAAEGPESESGPGPVTGRPDPTSSDHSPPGGSNSESELRGDGRGSTAPWDGGGGGGGHSQEAQYRNRAANVTVAIRLGAFSIRAPERASARRNPVVRTRSTPVQAERPSHNACEWVLRHTRAARPPEACRAGGNGSRRGPRRRGRLRTAASDLPPPFCPRRVPEAAEAVSDQSARLCRRLPPLNRLRSRQGCTLTAITARL
jgi:hypothetical protein